MSHRGLASFIVILLAAFATPAQAQLAPGYMNPFDQASDFPATWYQYGDPFGWSIDSTPVDGHSGSSLNWNNGSDMAGNYPWGYWYTAELNMAQYDTPILSFWCRWDMDPDPWWHYREIYIYETSWQYYYYAPFNVDNDGNGSIEFDCGATQQWHQHVFPMPAGLDTATNVVFQFYTYLNDSDGAGYEGWFIDDFAILVPDVTPPDSILDLAASNASLTEMTVTWSSPADDDISGVTASFDLRYSTSPITDANFSSATQLSNEPIPDVEGTPHTMVLTGLTEDTTYFFAVQTTDNAGNVSSISNVASLATLAPPPPPPAPSTGGGTSEPKDLRADDILPCAAGTTAVPTGVFALAGLLALAFAVRRK
jgi:hypothetical protein